MALWTWPMEAPAVAFLLKVVEELVWGGAEFAEEGFDDEWVGEWWSGVLGFRKLADVGFGQQVTVHAEHLGEFEGGAFQFAEGTECFACGGLVEVGFGVFTGQCFFAANLR
ncbi:hypothetical protein [Rubritalea tangerina]|uniref:hypothetical protein n=1 Tax=Rubritalea tangerina TaxID=430798 RepID=UPI00360869AE